MRRQSINFTDPNSDWIKAEVESSEYNSASDLVNDLIRQRRQEEGAKIGVIRALILEGIESDITDLTPQQTKDQVKCKRRGSGGSL